MNSRRSFIKKAALVSSFAVSSNQSIFGIMSRKRDENPIIGHGAHKYKVDKTLQRVSSSESLIQELDTKVYSKLSLKLDDSKAARIDDEADLLTPFKTPMKQ